MNEAVGDHLLTLPSGRTIGYAIYGDPDGTTVLNCHGGLVSGHDVQPGDRDARALGLRIVSPDRPGVGRTDRLTGHGMIPWVRADLIALLEHLQVDSFAVMGWSEGGQYALAVAFELNRRVTRCAVVAGCLPLDESANFRELNRLDRALTRLSEKVPFLARSYFALIGILSKLAPHLLVRSAARGLPKTEAEAVIAQGRWLPTILGEGARQPRGGVDEYLAMSAPWGFIPEDVAVPTRIFHGTADQLVPAAWGKQLAGRVPGATVTLYTDEGHFIALTRRREILEYLAGDTLDSVGSKP
jgi:pimeloyl-ACP methyl ester carboxylesterase